MSTAVNPPLSDAVVEIPDEKVDAYVAAGWSVVKAKRTTKKSDRNSDEK